MAEQLAEEAQGSEEQEQEQEQEDSQEQQGTEGGAPEGGDLESQVKALKEQLDSLMPLKKEVAGYRKRAQAAEQRAEQAEAEMEAMRSKVVVARLEAAAAGKVVDPSVLPSLIDTTEMTVDTTREELEAAIDALLKEKPYLAADGRTPSGDVGHRGESAPAQLDKNDWLRKHVRAG